jgi:hypothetical protein
VIFASDWTSEMAKPQQAAQQPEPAAPEPVPDPSSEHSHWKTSDGGPPVPHDDFELPEPIRGVSN